MARNRTLSFYFDNGDTSDTSVYKWSNRSIVGIGHCCTARIRTLANHFVVLVQVTGSLLPQYACDLDFGPASLQDRPLAQETRFRELGSGNPACAHAVWRSLQRDVKAGNRALSVQFDIRDTSDTSCV